MIEFYRDDSGIGGWLIVLLIFFSWFPLIFSLILSIIASVSVKKLKKHDIEIPQKTKRLIKINKFHIPILILVFIIGFILKDNKYDTIIDKKLDNLYNSQYKILDKCSHSNEAGDNYEFVVLELENFDYPVISYFDWANDTYEDNYEELKQADKFNYHSYINSIFNKEEISLMEISNSEEYRVVSLSLLINSNYLNNKDFLKSKLRQITNKYVLQFPNYNFSLDVYFSNKIDHALINKYYIMMNDTDNCQSVFSKDIPITNALYIDISEDRDIDNEITESFNYISEY